MHGPRRFKLRMDHLGTDHRPLATLFLFATVGRALYLIQPVILRDRKLIRRVEMLGLDFHPKLVIEFTSICLLSALRNQPTRRETFTAR